LTSLTNHGIDEGDGGSRSKVAWIARPRSSTSLQPSCVTLDATRKNHCDQHRDAAVGDSETTSAANASTDARSNGSTTGGPCVATSIAAQTASI
jgi:hypothetical protein